MNKNKLFLLSLILLLSIAAISQNPINKVLNEYSSEENGVYDKSGIFSEIRQSEINYRSLNDEMRVAFQEILQTEFDKIDIAGLSIAVISEGDEWRSAIGKSSVSDSMNIDMVLGMGSISKSITAATILKLEEEGVLSINDPLFHWLDSYEFIDSNITIKQLLNHTSGIYNVTDNPKFFTAISNDNGKIWEPEEVLDTFLLEPYFKPGESWKYSNTNYILAGMVIESATYKKYREVVREKVLKPLGLDSIYLKPFETNSLEVAHFWLDPFGGTSAVDLTSLGYGFESLFSGAWAAGAYMSRPIDLAKWMETITSSDFLNENSKNEFYDGIDLGNNTYYGLGIVYILDTIGEKIIIGHNGNIGYTANAYYFPKNNLTIAVQCNDATIPADVLQTIVNNIYFKYIELLSDTEVLSSINSVKIYPIPANDRLFIDLDSDFSKQINATIFNSFGQKIKSYKLSNSKISSIDISDYNPGIYYIEIGGKTFKFQVLLKKP